MEFGFEFETCEFYQTYAKCHGFVVRKDDVSHDLKDSIVMYQLVCNREGLRDKKYFTRLDRIGKHRPVTRIRCPTRLHVYLDYWTSKWKVVTLRSHITMN